MALFCFFWPFCAVLAAQDSKVTPPAFSEEAVITRADAVGSSWNKWASGDSGLEQRVFRLPMPEARALLRRSLGRFQDFLDARQAYAQSVGDHLDASRTSPGAVRFGTQDRICEDQIQLLGVSLSALQDRLALLRDSTDWLAIRRGVQPEIARTLKLQAELRSTRLSAPLAQSTEPVSTLAYRDSEHVLGEALRRLWTAYYQALAIAVEQDPAAAALTPLRSAEDAEPPPAGSAVTPLAGVWTYIEGSQQFNGVSEPRLVLLELWMDSGNVIGRYRAELPDFNGPRNVDVRARGAQTSGGVQTLEIDAKDSAFAGQILLEGSGLGGELMLVRAPSAGSTLPRGRELLHRR